MGGICCSELAPLSSSPYCSCRANALQYPGSMTKIGVESPLGCRSCTLQGSIKVGEQVGETLGGPHAGPEGALCG